MKYLLFLLLSFSVYAEHKTPHRIRVVPDYIDENGLQTTTELNLYQGSTYINQFVEYETEDNLTVGAYFNNLPINVVGYHQTYTDDSYIGMSKWWGDKSQLRFGISSQIGTQLTGSNSNLLAFTTTQLQYTVFNSLTISVGPWWGNNAMTTVGNYVGASVNLGYKLNDSIRIEGSWYSGSTNLSGAVINSFYTVRKGIECYVGMQIPATNSGNEFAGNIGLNYHF